MDVVDTLRHQENLVSRELDEERREAELIERLRQIYRGQGIEVPDRVLQEGVKALKEQPLRLYAARAQPVANHRDCMGQPRSLGRRLLGGSRCFLASAGALIISAWSSRPAAGRTGAGPGRAQPDRARRDSAGRPAAEARGRAPGGQGPGGADKADRILADGRAAIARGDAEGARQAINDLEVLRADLRREYVLRIVSRPGEPSGGLARPAAQPGRAELLPDRGAGHARRANPQSCR